MASFVDRVVLHLAAGNGGHGVASIHREKFKPLGGPDGGNGGQRRRRRAGRRHQRPHPARLPPPPAPAGRQRQAGCRAATATAPTAATSSCACPTAPSCSTRTARCSPTSPAPAPASSPPSGGRGGLGNAALASTRRKAPGFALLGEPGEARDVVLELKSVADVGLVGFPSAGKSSLIAALSAARPKIADYPFTTLVPNLGVVSAGDTTFTVADVPGLIPGAAAGQGPRPGLPAPRRALRGAAARAGLRDARARPRPAQRPRRARGRARPVRGHLRRAAGQAAAGRAEQGRRARGARARRAGAARARGPRAARVRDLAPSSHAGPARADLRPGRGGRGRPRRARRCPRRRASCCARRAVDDAGFTVEPDPDEPGGFVVRGEKPERWVRQTDFDNDEAVGYLADRLARLGVEEELAELGRRARRRGHHRRRHLRLRADRRHRRRRLRADPARHRRAARAGRPAPRADERLAAKKARRERRATTTATGTPSDGRRATREPRGGRRGAAHRGQGRLVVADRRAAGSTRTGSTRSSTRSPRACQRRPAGRAGVLRRDRRRHRPARAARPGRATSPPSRPRPASGSCCSPSATPPSFARYGLHGRAGAAHRRRPAPPRPLPQRRADPGAAARARRHPDRQRERHRRHPRDPLRRQRPAGRAGRAPRPRRRARAALRRRRPLHRQARPARARVHPRGRVDGRRWPGWTSAGSGSHVGSGGMATKIDAAAIATSEGIPVRAGRGRAHRRRAGRARPARSSTRPATARASRLFWLRHATTPRGRLHARRRRGDAPSCSGARRCCRPASPRVQRRVLLRRAGRAGRPGRRRRSPAAWSATTPPTCRRCSGTAPPTCRRSSAASSCTATTSSCCSRR